MEKVHLSTLPTQKQLLQSSFTNQSAFLSFLMVTEEIKRVWQQLEEEGDPARERERAREVKWASVSGCWRGVPWDGEGGHGARWRFQQHTNTVRSIHWASGTGKPRSIGTLCRCHTSLTAARRLYQDCYSLFKLRNSSGH